MQPSASRTAAANAAPWLAKPGQASARPAQYYKSIVYDHDRSVPSGPCLESSDKVADLTAKHSMCCMIWTLFYKKQAISP